MAKKCPPGVLCIENSTIISLLLIVIVLGVIVYFNRGQMNTNNANNGNSNNKDKIIVIDNNSNTGYFNKPSTMMSLIPGDLFLNPHAPPLKQNRFFPPNNIDVRGVPINMRTSHYNMSYKQVGILTREHGKETILPIFGRPLHSNRNKWQYYTMTDKNNMIRLPISRNGRSCTNEYGCDELFNGENVYVEGYKDSFNVTIYENDTPRYIPYL